MTNKDKLCEQLKVVLKLIDEKYKEDQRKGVMELIYIRYSNALQLIRNNEINKEKLYISGGVRAYLDSYSDYNNPLLDEMDKAEKLVGELLK
ncbi:hypothetical protein [Clostridium sp.]|uniref:hypothetical protein n=1 Tax=Clostridium sp. TaxID=1506 RepID=UPI0026035C73|nr:hypothetical protein [uncultured Clostridium sp.]